MKVGDLAMDGSWWRFDRYDLRGEFVRPAPSARLARYSPWESVARVGGRGDVVGIAEEFAALNLASEAEILAWVTRWGLLGILPHLLEQADFAGGVSYVRTPVGWSLKVTAADLDFVSGHTQEAPPALPPGRCIVADWYGAGKQIRDASEFWGAFFPAGMPARGYPAPTTGVFWHAYGESLADFAAVASMVRRAMLGYAVAARGATTEQEAHEVRRARQWVRANASVHVDTPFLTEPGTRTVSLVTSSLISLIATELWLDWAAGREVRACARPSCSRLFVTGLYNRHYCSSRCKSATNMRAWRRNRKGQVISDG